MEKKAKLINKVKRLLKRLGCPRWLHHFGPKKYEFWQHIAALLVKQECKLGYRRVSRLLDYLGFDVPTYSALAKMVKRIPLVLWQNILKLTASFKVRTLSLLTAQECPDRCQAHTITEELTSHILLKYL